METWTVSSQALSHSPRGHNYRVWGLEQRLCCGLWDKCFLMCVQPQGAPRL